MTDANETTHATRKTETPTFDSLGLSPEQRADDIMRRFPQKDGMLLPCDARELRGFIVRAIRAEAAELSQLKAGITKAISENFSPAPSDQRGSP